MYSQSGDNTAGQRASQTEVNGQSGVDPDGINGHVVVIKMKCEDLGSFISTCLRHDIHEYLSRF